MALGRRKSDNTAMTEDDLKETSNDILFSKMAPDSPKRKTSQKEKLIESNMPPIEIRSYLRQVYFNDHPTNKLFH